MSVPVSKVNIKNSKNLTSVLNYAKLDNKVSISDTNFRKFKRNKRRLKFEFLSNSVLCEVITLIRRNINSQTLTNIAYKSSFGIFTNSALSDSDRENRK